MIRLSLYCACENKAVFSSSRQSVIDDMDRMFREFHSGEGHEVFPTQEEAREAAGSAVTS